MGDGRRYQWEFEEEIRLSPRWSVPQILIKGLYLGFKIILLTSILLK